MSDLQSQIEACGEEIFALVDSQKKLPDAINPAVWYGRLMEWTMGKENLKVQTLRFVDTLPVLNSSRALNAHMHEYFGDPSLELAGPLKLGLGLSSLAPWLVGPVVRTGVKRMARAFITGRTGAEAVRELRKIRSRKVGFTVDILGEAVVSEREADEYQARYMELIESLAAEAKNWEPIEQLEGAGSGPRRIPAVNVSVKISALYSQIHPADPATALFHLKRRLRPLFQRAKELGAFINLDMESYAVKDLTLDLFESLLDEPEFADFHNAGLVIQAYLQDSGEDFEQLLEWAKSRHRRITIRLVKGAYWDFETVIARQRRWPIPVYLRKPESDANFERITRRMLDNSEYIYSAFGSHNVRSIAHAMVYAQQVGLGPADYEIQMLYGMAEPIKKAMVQLGHRVREYCPVGEMLPGMAYLVRRLLENNSNDGFLKAKFITKVDSSELLRDPQEIVRSLPLSNGVAPRREFENDPPEDFTLPETREKMRLALERERDSLGRNYPLVIGNRDVTTAEKMDSVNPTRPGQLIGSVAKATIADADAAVEAATKAFQRWRLVPAEGRAALLDKLADIMKRERFPLAALEVLEVGKPWVEADADVSEAIDFCEFYAAEMRRLGQPEPTHRVPGEAGYTEYIPRGAGLVVAPWNFPLAILCGMTVAALVAGNTVIMKPAEQSSIVAARFMQLCREAGFPPGVLNLLTGLGEEVGEHLVNHPKIDFIVFTGSKEVGLHIWESAGKTRPGQANLKKVVCEMGGKNALIIDSDADQDEAVIGALYAAFGFQGQKCSALSRLIVLSENYDRFLHRLVEAASDLVVGDPANPNTIVGPVIDADAHQRILRVVEAGKQEARLAFEGRVPNELKSGYFVPPTIFAEVPPNAKLARTEIFGPVLSVFRVDTLDEAIALANDTEFALTAGIYSRSPANLDRARRELIAGNVYLNRAITGAIVARHPFGGFKMSGGGTKAGGKDYLLQFLFPRVVTENVMRRGFAPAEEESISAAIVGISSGVGM